MTWRNKAKGILYLFLNRDAISFVLLPQASEPCLNFNISKNNIFPIP